LRFGNQIFAGNGGNGDVFVYRSMISDSSRTLVFGDSLARGAGSRDDTNPWNGAILP
jgi:hypothetical protein